MSFSKVGPRTAATNGNAAMAAAIRAGGQIESTKKCAPLNSWRDAPPQRVAGRAAPRRAAAVRGGARHALGAPALTQPHSLRPRARSAGCARLRTPCGLRARARQLPAVGRPTPCARLVVRARPRSALALTRAPSLLYDVCVRPRPSRCRREEHLGGRRRRGCQRGQVGRGDGRAQTCAPRDRPAHSTATTRPVWRTRAMRNSLRARACPPPHARARVLSLASRLSPRSPGGCNPRAGTPSPRLPRARRARSLARVRRLPMLALPRPSSPAQTRAWTRP